MINLCVCAQVVNRNSQVDENKEIMDSILIPPEISTRSSHVTMVDKEIDDVKKVKS